jgi:two-component system sporulation sensor kinase C
MLSEAIEHRQAANALRQSETQRAEADKLAAEGRMAARVAHEINNPLAGIKSAFQLVKKAVPKQHPRYEYVGRIEKEIDRIAAIVRQMLDLHRAEREPSFTISIDDTLGDVIAMLEPVIEKQGIAVEIERINTTATVNLPENALRQILYTILINAIEASPKKSMVRVQATETDGQLKISVSDQGPGISKKIRNRVFEPFFTTKGKEATGGLGLGLPIAKSIATALGGNLDFKSPPQQGCTFTITLPLETTEQDNE